MPKINLKVPDREVLGHENGSEMSNPVRPVQPNQRVHLERWTHFSEKIPGGPNWSIEYWTEIYGNFGSMDRALDVIKNSSILPNLPIMHFASVASFHLTVGDLGTRLIDCMGLCIFPVMM